MQLSEQRIAGNNMLRLEMCFTNETNAAFQDLLNNEITHAQQ